MIKATVQVRDQRWDRERLEAGRIQIDGFETSGDARAWADRLGARARAKVVHSGPVSSRTWSVRLEAQFRATATAGSGMNKAGVSRFRKALAMIGSDGVETEWDTGFESAVDRERFERILEAAGR